MDAIRPTTHVAQTGAGRNRTDEWRFCSSRGVFAGLCIPYEAVTSARLTLSAAPCDSRLFASFPGRSSQDLLIAGRDTDVLRSMAGSFSLGVHDLRLLLHVVRLCFGARVP